MANKEEAQYIIWLKGLHTGGYLKEIDGDNIILTNKKQEARQFTMERAEAKVECLRSSWIVYKIERVEEWNK